MSDRAAQAIAYDRLETPISPYTSLSLVYIDERSQSSHHKTLKVPAHVDRSMSNVARIGTSCVGEHLDLSHKRRVWHLWPSRQPRHIRNSWCDISATKLLAFP